MRKKLAGIHLLAPLSETDIVDYSRNLDRELIVNSTIVTDAIVDTVEKTNYIVTFEYDTTLDGGTHQIRRSIPTLELLSYTGENMSGAHWVNVEDMDYHYITSGTSSQQAFEELDEQLSKVCFLKHLVDGVGDASLISSNDNKTPLSTVDNSEYAFVLGNIHTLTASNYGVILGGYDSNILSSLYSSIFNGYNNTITHSYASFINSGRNNTIDADTDSTFIISGMYNKIENAADSGIIGGHDNYIYGANNSYGSIIIGSVEGYIDSSHFSVISNTANSYITGGKYNEISVSSYIEIVNSSSSSVSTSMNNSIANSTYVNIIASVYSSQNLSIYASDIATIQSSSNSYIWHCTNGFISSSTASSIGYMAVPDAVSSISKTTTNLGVSSLTNFNIGQLVLLIGAEYTSYTTEYRISNIDTINNLLYFSNNDINGTDITFNASNSIPINIKPLNVQYDQKNIISNTTDTVVCSYAVNTNVSYAIIGNTKTKYAIIPASGVEATTNTIKLKLHGSDTVITNLTPNAFAGLVIHTYTDNMYALSSSILSSTECNIYNANNIMIGASGTGKINNASKCILLGTTEGYIFSGSNGALLANTDSILSSFSNTIIAGGINHYINGTNSSAIIGGKENKIIGVSVGAIIGGSKNTIKGSSNSIIIGSNDSAINADIFSCANVVMIACDKKIADRSNALFTDSITLTERTLVLKDNSGTKTPQIGDVLLVESVDGNVATVTWGKSSTGNINSLFETANYMLWGESVMIYQYITVDGAQNSNTIEDMAVGLTKNGFITYDYLNSPNYMWEVTDPDSLYNATDGISIDVGYKYVIKFDSFNAEWLDASSSAPVVNMSNPTTITIVNNPQPDNNYCISYSTDTGLSGNIINGWGVLNGSIQLPNFASSGASAPQMLLTMHRASSTVNAMMTLSVSELPMVGTNAQEVQTSIYTDETGQAYVIWPTEYDLPTGGVDSAWFRSPDGAVGLDTASWRQVVSVVNPTNRIVKISAGGNPNPTYRPCYIWWPKDSPRFKAATNISVIKMSTSIFP